MDVKIRYLSHEVAKSFGSSEKVETIHLPDQAKYEDVLNMLEEKLRCHGKTDEELLDTFILLCEDGVVHRIKDEALNHDCKVLVGYADFGG